jgi:RimJ/RimL family protein N-acetyltransferase
LTDIHLEPWGDGDLPLLRRTLGDPEMTKHLGGPESEEKLVERQRRFERLPEAGTGRMFKIVDDATAMSSARWGTGDGVARRGDLRDRLDGASGVPGPWDRGGRDELAIAAARADGGCSWVHAFPSVENEPSNAICRKLGFTLVEEIEFEYPPGSLMRCNDWRLEL